MKHTALATLALLSTLGLAAVASARDSLFEEGNVVVDAAFYSGDPESEGKLLSEVWVNNSPGAATLPDIEAATYVILEYESASYTFELAESGTNKNTVHLLVGDERTMTLDALVDGLAENPALLEQLGS